MSVDRGAEDAVERIDPAETLALELALHVSRYRFVAPLVAGRCVLDAGCGVGYGSAEFTSEPPARYLAVDRSVAAIRVARRLVVDLAVDDSAGAALRDLDARLADVVDADAGLLLVLPRLVIGRGRNRHEAADGLVAAEEEDAAALGADAAVVIASRVFGLVARTLHAIEIYGVEETEPTLSRPSSDVEKVSA